MKAVYILFLLGIFSIPFMVAAGVQISNTSMTGVVIQLPTVAAASSNTSLDNVNSSDYWDNLDTPADILFSDLSASSIDVTNYNVTADWGFFNSINVSNNSIYIGGNKISSEQNTITFEGANVTASYFSGDGSELTNINASNLLYGLLQKANATGPFNGSVVTSGTDSSKNTANVLFQVVSDTRNVSGIPVPQLMVQDGGANQASLMVRSWIVVNQNNTLLTSAQNNICSDWGFLELDCNTASTGADFGVTDDVEVLGLVWTRSGYRAHVETPSPYFVAEDNGTAKFSGVNGNFTLGIGTFSTDVFCDYVSNNFVSNVTDTWIEITDQASDFEGTIGDIKSFINSSCVSIEKNQGWSNFTNVEWQAIHAPEVAILKGGTLLLDGPVLVGGTDASTNSDGDAYFAGRVKVNSGLRSISSTHGVGLMAQKSTVVSTHVGLTAEFNNETNDFCDTLLGAFTSDDVGNFIAIPVATPSDLEGTTTRITAFINSSCVRIDPLVFGNDVIPNSSGITYVTFEHPIFAVLDNGIISASAQEVEFKIDGTTFSGFFIDDTASSNQHQAFTLNQKIENYAGIVAFNIFGSSSSTNKSTAVDYHLQTLEMDTSNINESTLTYIGALQFGENVQNNIDFLHLSGEFTNIIKSGDNDVIIKAYYDNGIGTTVDSTTEFKSPATDLTIFENDNSYIYLAATVNFTTIGVSLDTGSSGNIVPLFFYCNTSGDWIPPAGAPTDTTDGFKQSGTIHYSSPADRGTCNQEIDGTPFANTTNYHYVAIQRTKNNIVTDPIENLFTISGGGNLMLLRDDYMRLNPVDTAPETCDATTLGGIYYDISEDDMCICKSTGWREMTGGTACS